MSEQCRVFDCFTFARELDLLSFRLELLSNVVDHFVIVEAPRTHSGFPKELVFEASRQRFAKYLDRIIHVVVEDLPPPEPDRWVPERFQRRAILRGLEGARSTDIALVTDVDEIPDPEIVRALKKTMPERVGLKMRTCYQRANWESKQVWPLARAARVGAFCDPEALRQSDPSSWVNSAGAHLTYLMEPAQIAEKYAAFAHSEHDSPRDRSVSYLQLCRAMAMTPHSTELLSIRGLPELGPVQRALFERRPDLFDFRNIARPIRNSAQRWARVRRWPALPIGVVLAGDKAHQRVLAGAAHLRVPRKTGLVVA